MADDDDAIYVLVKAKLDDASADEAESRLRDKFKDAAQDIGDHFKDATKSFGDAVKDYLDQDIKDSIKDFGRDLRDEVRSGHIGDALHDINHSIRGTTDLVTNLGEAFGVHLDGVGSFGRSITGVIDELGSGVDKITEKIHGLTTGDIPGRLGALSDLTRSGASLFGPGDVGDTLSGISDFLNNTQSIAQGLQQLKGFKGGNVQGGLAGLQTLFAGVDPMLGNQPGSGDSVLGKLGKVAAAAAAGAGAGALVPGFDATGIPEIVGLIGGAGLGAYDQFLNPKPQGPQLPPQLQDQLSLAQSTARAHSEVRSHEALENLMLGGPSTPMVTARPGESPVQTILQTVTAPPVSQPSGGAASISAQHATVTAGSATVTAGSVNLSGVSLPGASSPSFSRAPSMTAPTAIPGVKSWFSTGGLLPGESPGHDNILGKLGGTPIGLEGGEFVVNPEATQAYLPLLKAINMSHFDEGGQVPTDTGGGGQGPIQQQGIGQGKGMTVGGGLLGAAEQAGAMMAGPLAPAAQIAEQEANLAIQNTGKIIADLAMAPIETLWLGGGQLGARSVGSPAKAGWMGKLLGGIIGEGTANLQNLAGSVMKPKQPDQPGQQDIHQGPTAQPPAGPQGTADDPMHVKNVGGQQGHPQGVPTSAANMVNPMLNQLSPG